MSVDLPRMSGQGLQFVVQHIHYNRVNILSY